MPYNRNRRSIISAVGKIKRFIDDHPGHGMSTAALAEQYQLSSKTLQKVFKEKFSISIGQYKLIARLRAAKELLGSGRSVKEVTFKLNYSSPSSFSNAFRNFYKISASQWIDYVKANANKQVQK